MNTMGDFLARRRQSCDTYAPCACTICTQIYSYIMMYKGIVYIYIYIDLTDCRVIIVQYESIIII